MNAINEIANYDNKESIANRFRNKRFRFFEEKLQKLAQDYPIRILDVGGTLSFWVNRGYHKNPNYHITLLNLEKVDSDYPNLVSVQGDACDLSEYRDQEFDIVFSNSVIEHLFTYSNQQRMADEVQRVGKYYFIQTPNRTFFIEPHFLLPFFHYLPFKLRFYILTKTTISRGVKVDAAIADRMLREIRLLSLREMKALFPGSKLYLEKFMMMNKSITVHNLED